MSLRYLAHTVRNKFFLLLLLLCTANILPAQEFQNEPSAVIRLLKDVEATHNVRFSFNRRDLKDLQCTYKPNSETLEATLEALQQQCGLRFYRIDERYIAVQLNTIPVVSVCATIIDTSTGEPLQGASVIASNFQGITDSGGKFTIESIAENASISVYYLGFKVKEVFANELSDQTNCPLLFTDEKFNYLPTVVLNSYLTKGISKNSEGSITISNEDFEILPNLIEPDVLRIAQILPGIESFNETASRINIRGGKSDEVLLLWDDIRMYQSGHFFGLISAFNPNLTQKVTIYKNGTHPRYGKSVSGVISMLSDSEIPEQVSGAASIDFISTQFYAKIPASEKIAFHLSGRTSINTGIGNPVYKQFFSRVFQNTIVTNLETETAQGLRSTDESFNFYDLNFKGIYQLSNKDKLEYNFLTIFNRLDFSERFTGETTISRNESELKERTLVHGLSWERTWNTKLNTAVLFNSVNYVINGGNQNIDSGQLQSQRNEVNEKEIKLDLRYTLNRETSFNGGYQYTDTEIINVDSPFETNEFERQRDVLFSNGLYLNSNLKFFDNATHLSAGIRFTHYPHLDSQFLEPRLNIFQKLSSEFSLSATAELKHQAIVQTTRVRNNLLGIETQPWIVLNSAESAILESKQISLGGNFRSQNWGIGIEGFYKNVNNINSANQGFRNQLIDVVAAGSYAVYGTEFSLSRKTEKLNTWLSYTYMDNTYRFNALVPASFRSNFDVRHTFSFAASYSWNDLLFSVGSNYHSGLPFTQPVAGNEIVTKNGKEVINYMSPNSSTLKEFFRTDFSASYTRKLDDTFSAKLSLALLNIFDRRNALDTYYLLENDSEGNSVLNKVEQFSLGFTPNISLKLLF